MRGWGLDLDLCIGQGDTQAVMDVATGSRPEALQAQCLGRSSAGLMVRAAEEGPRRPQ